MATNPVKNEKESTEAPVAPATPEQTQKPEQIASPSEAAPKSEVVFSNPGEATTPNPERKPVIVRMGDTIRIDY